MIRFRAQLELKPAAESGGRRSPIRSGYRAMTAHADRYVSAAFDLVDAVRLDPGDGVEAIVQIPSLTLQDWAPRAGGRFDVFEAPSPGAGGSTR